MSKVSATQTKLWKRKTMLIEGVRTSIKLEPEFWKVLMEEAVGRNLRVSALIRGIASEEEYFNLASLLRVHALNYLRHQEKYTSKALELSLVLRASPLPEAILSDALNIEEWNDRFQTWLKIDPLGIRNKSILSFMRFCSPDDGSKSDPNLVWRRLREGGEAQKIIALIINGILLRIPVTIARLPTPDTYAPGRFLLIFEPPRE